MNDYLERYRDEKYIDPSLDTSPWGGHIDEDFADILSELFNDCLEEATSHLDENEDYEDCNLPEDITSEVESEIDSIAERIFDNICKLIHSLPVYDISSWQETKADFTLEVRKRMNKALWGRSLYAPEQESSVYQCTPTRRFEILGSDPDKYAEGTPEWEHAMEIVGFRNE